MPLSSFARPVRFSDALVCLDLSFLRSWLEVRLVETVSVSEKLTLDDYEAIALTMARAALRAALTPGRPTGSGSLPCPISP